MHVYRVNGSITVRAPAKLNLFFEVLGKRADGFHEIETLMAPIGLYDTLMLRADPSGQVALQCAWAGQRSGSGPLGVLPPAEQNLATRAVRLLAARSGTSLGCTLQLVKRIPSAAGLGGGSSDAAAALVGANLAWELGWPRERLAELAAELGSDVPFFLGQGAAVCRGRGERVDPIAALGALDAVVVRPPEGLSTAEVYRHCRPPASPRRVESVVEALRVRDWRRLQRLVFNRLEEAAAGLSPWVARLRDEFARLGCTPAQLSGSGTSYFALCRSARHALQVAGRLRARGVGNVYAVRM